MPDRTEPTAATEAEEAAEASVPAGADSPPTAEEEAGADSNEPDPAVAKSEQEFNARGANVKGEGQLP